MVKSSIIIRCFNEEAHIGRLLSGVMHQTGADFEVIIVDSGSTDATLSIVQQYPAKIVHIKKEDFSFGRSLNMGCAAARGEYLVFASAHVYPVYQDWIAQLVQPFENPRIASVYGKQRGNEATKFSEHQVFSRWFPEVSDLNQDHPFCNNANAAIRRSLWETSQYDETLTGLEDLAWARRVMSMGYRIAYVSDAEVVHVHDEKLGQVMNRYRREAIAMKAIYPNEKFSFFSFLYMFVKNFFSDARSAFKARAFWQNVVSIALFRLMQFWGTYRGYAQHGAVNRALRQKFYYPADDADSAKSEFHGATRKDRIDYSVHDKDDMGD